MIIWGTRTKGEPRGFVLTNCWRCGGEQVHFVAEVKKKFTLYFVPTFTLSRKAAIICTRCEWQTDIEGEEGGAHIDRAIPQAEMVAELERRERASSGGPSRGRSASSNGPAHTLAVGMLVAALEVAMADERLEVAETDALGESVREMALRSGSSIIRDVAATIIGDLPELIDWIQSPRTPPFHAMLSAAGREARGLAKSDRERYFGQVSWLCHQIAEAGRQGTRPVALGSLARVDQVLQQMSLTTVEVSTALDYCEQHGG